jgi:hypothetical protein
MSGTGAYQAVAQSLAIPRGMSSAARKSRLLVPSAYVTVLCRKDSIFMRDYKIIVVI